LAAPVLQDPTALVIRDTIVPTNYGTFCRVWLVETTEYVFLTVPRNDAHVIYEDRSKFCRKSAVRDRSTVNHLRDIPIFELVRAGPGVKLPIANHRYFDMHGIDMPERLLRVLAL
jgi:hypothetical protein